MVVVDVGNDVKVGNAGGIVDDKPRRILLFQPVIGLFQPGSLIGAFDNIWTLRVTQKLRFGFESKNGEALIVDRKSGDKTTWATAWDLPYQKLSKDYAIVARIHDNTTGQPVIIAAGISEEGTEAAGEILYNPVYLNSLLAKAPANWEKMNMEAVIETQVIEGHSGPPNILALEIW